MDRSSKRNNKKSGTNTPITANRPDNTENAQDVALPRSRTQEHTDHKRGNRGRYYGKVNSVESREKGAALSGYKLSKLNSAELQSAKRCDSNCDIHEMDHIKESSETNVGSKNSKIDIGIPCDIKALDARISTGNGFRSPNLGINKLTERNDFSQDRNAESRVENANSVVQGGHSLEQQHKMLHNISIGVEGGRYTSSEYRVDEDEVCQPQTISVKQVTNTCKDHLQCHMRSPHVHEEHQADGVKVFHQTERAVNYTDGHANYVGSFPNLHDANSCGHKAYEERLSRSTEFRPHDGSKFISNDRRMDRRQDNRRSPKDSSLHHIHPDSCTMSNIDLIRVPADKYKSREFSQHGGSSVSRSHMHAGVTVPYYQGGVAIQAAPGVQAIPIPGVVPGMTPISKGHYMTPGWVGAPISQVPHPVGYVARSMVSSVMGSVYGSPPRNEAPRVMQVPKRKSSAFQIKNPETGEVVNVGSKTPVSTPKPPVTSTVPHANQLPLKGEAVNIPATSPTKEKGCDSLVTSTPQAAPMNVRSVVPTVQATPPLAQVATTADIPSMNVNVYHAPTPVHYSSYSYSGYLPLTPMYARTPRTPLTAGYTDDELMPVDDLRDQGSGRIVVAPPQVLTPAKVLPPRNVVPQQLIHGVCARQFSSQVARMDSKDTQKTKFKVFNRPMDLCEAVLALEERHPKSDGTARPSMRSHPTSRRVKNTAINEQLAVIGNTGSTNVPTDLSENVSDLPSNDITPRQKMTVTAGGRSKTNNKKVVKLGKVSSGQLALLVNDSEGSMEIEAHISTAAVQERLKRSKGSAMPAKNEELEKQEHVDENVGHNVDKVVESNAQEVDATHQSDEIVGTPKPVVKFEEVLQPESVEVSEEKKEVSATSVASVENKPESGTGDSTTNASSNAKGNDDKAPVIIPPISVETLINCAFSCKKVLPSPNMGFRVIPAHPISGNSGSKDGRESRGRGLANFPHSYSLQTQGSGYTYGNQRSRMFDKAKTDGKWRREPKPETVRITPLKKPEISREERFKRTVRSLLNKLTVEKFLTVSQNVAKLYENLTIQDDVYAMVDLVLDKAVSELHYSDMYADLVYLLKYRFNDAFDIGFKSTMFYRVLLNKCQDSFEALSKMNPEDISEEEKADALVDAEEEPEDSEISDFAKGSRRLTKKIVLGTIRFMGELFLRKILSVAILQRIARTLLKMDTGGPKVPYEHLVEGFIELITTIGYTLDQYNSGSDMLNEYMIYLTKLMNDGNYSLRIVYKIQDLIDLRKKRWVKKVFKEKATSVADIHLEAKKDELKGGAIHINQEGKFMTAGLQTSRHYTEYLLTQRHLAIAKTINGVFRGHNHSSASVNCEGAVSKVIDTSPATPTNISTPKAISPSVAVSKPEKGIVKGSSTSYDSKKLQKKGSEVRFAMDNISVVEDIIDIFMQKPNPERFKYEWNQLAPSNQDARAAVRRMLTICVNAKSLVVAEAQADLIAVTISSLLKGASSTLGAFEIFEKEYLVRLQDEVLDNPQATSLFARILTHVLNKFGSDQQVMLEKIELPEDCEVARQLATQVLSEMVKHTNQAEYARRLFQSSFSIFGGDRSSFLKDI